MGDCLGRGGRAGKNSQGIWRYEDIWQEKVGPHQKQMKGNRPHSAVLKFEGLLEEEDTVTIFQPPKLELNLGCGCSSGEG